MVQCTRSRGCASRWKVSSTLLDSSSSLVWQACVPSPSPSLAKAGNTSLMQQKTKSSQLAGGGQLSVSGVKSLRALSSWKTEDLVPAGAQWGLEVKEKLKGWTEAGAALLCRIFSSCHGSSTAVIPPKCLPGEASPSLLPSWRRRFHLMGPPRRISSRAFPWTTATVAQVCCPVLKILATSAEKQSTSLLLHLLTASFFFFSFSFLSFPRRRSRSSAIFGSPRQAPRPHPNLWQANYFSLKEEGSTLYLGDRNSAATWRRAVYTVASCCSAHVRNNISAWKGHSRGWPAFTAPLC